MARVNKMDVINLGNEELTILGKALKKVLFNSSHLMEDTRTQGVIDNRPPDVIPRRHSA